MKTIKISKKIKEIYRIKQIISFNKYKMFKISAKAFAKNCVYNIIDKEKTLWLRNKDIGEKEGVQYIYGLVHKEIKGKFNNKNPAKQQIKKSKKMHQN